VRGSTRWVSPSPTSLARAGRAGPAAGVTDAERLQELIGRTAQLTFRPVDRRPRARRSEATTRVLTARAGRRARRSATTRPGSCAATDDGGGRPETGEMLPAQVRRRARRADRRAHRRRVPGARRRPGLRGVAAARPRSGERRSPRSPPSSPASVTWAAGPARDRARRCRRVGAERWRPASPAASGSATAAQITVGAGTLSEQEQQARDLALVLRTGALPITLEPSTFEQVSATLGAESLRSGLLAGLIGLALVGAG
jgi:preprotein translocase subunit SecD